MNKIILIADDSPISRKILKQCIGPEGYEIHEAADGAAAVEKFKSLRPSVTFMDLTMPVMDGMQALKEIKQIDENAVVIVATADVQVQTLFRVMNLGALTMIKKPLTKEAVQDALQKAQAAAKDPD